MPFLNNKQIRKLVQDEFPLPGGVSHSAAKELSLNLIEMRNIIYKIEKILSSGDADMLRIINICSIINEAEAKPSRRHKS